MYFMKIKKKRLNGPVEEQKTSGQIYTLLLRDLRTEVAAETPSGARQVTWPHTTDWMGVSRDSACPV